MLADSQGKFNFPIIPSGTHTVKFQSLDPVNGNANSFPIITRDVTVPIGSAATLTVTMPGGQGIVRGTVTDDNNQAVVGATVRVVETGQTTTTGLHGFYQFDERVRLATAVPAAPLTLRVSKTGLPPTTRTFNLCHGETAVVNVSHPSPASASFAQPSSGNATTRRCRAPSRRSSRSLPPPPPTAPGSSTIVDVPNGTQSLVTSKTGLLKRYALGDGHAGGR